MIAQRQREKELAPDLEWTFPNSQLRELEDLMDRAYQESRLPEERDRQAVHPFLVDCRLGRASAD